MKQQVSKIVFVAVGAVSLLLSQISPALATPGPYLAANCAVHVVGRCENEGYMTGRALIGLGVPAGIDPVWPAVYGYTDALGTNRSWAVPSNVDRGLGPGVAVGAFIALVQNYLFRPSGGCPLFQPNPAIDTYDACDTYRRIVNGATFLVLVMTGGKYTTYPDAVFDTVADPNGRIQVAVADAQAEFPAWSKLITKEDRAGLIDWDAAVTFPAGHLNSTQEDAYRDVAVYPYIAETPHAILIRNAWGNMEINRGCGNMVGDFGQLNDDDMQAGLYAAKDAVTGAPVAQFVPGGKYNITPAIQNVGDATSDVVYLELKAPDAFVLPTAADGADPPNGTGSGVSAGGCIAGYPQVNVTSSPPAACVGPHWWWQYDAMAARGPVTFQKGNFTISPATPLGTNICFQSDVVNKTIADEGDPNDFALSPQVLCYPVVASATPSVTGFNGDVHAGGGIGACATGVPANIDTNPAAGSLGQYVVSASGLIGTFGSNGAPLGNQLSLGATGTYAQVCRPDLYGYATTHMNGVGWTTPGTIDLSTVPPAISVIFANGPTSVFGTLTHKLTIVSSGTVTISGDVLVTGGIDRTDVPSLGIITGPASDINIAAAATTVQAYLFSDGNIDTCASPPYTACTNTLTVDGFLMGRNLLLHRLGPPNSVGASAGEQVYLTPQLYLNPPSYFDSSVNNNNLNGLGERQPLF